MRAATAAIAALVAVVAKNHGSSYTVQPGSGSGSNSTSNGTDCAICPDSVPYNQTTLYLAEVYKQNATNDLYCAFLERALHPQSAACAFYPNGTVLEDPKHICPQTSLGNCTAPAAGYGLN